ncbi:MAG: tetraacyldisaccharide 4'-kinase [Pseudomonadota bacterium]
MGIGTSIEQLITRAWYHDSSWLRCLRPLSALYAHVFERIKQDKLKMAWQAPIPVIVVGNITVGGSGKTPVLIALIEALRAQGFRPGVISRGYQSAAEQDCVWVTAESHAKDVGDEPLLIAQRTQCPVVSGANRRRSIEVLVANDACDVIVCDDGLQHYQLARDINVCVFDMKRGLGNERCLPEGPLREPILRVSHIDFSVSNQPFDPRNTALNNAFPAPYLFKTVAHSMHSLGTNEPTNLSAKAVHAVSGISHPIKFFDALREQGFEVIEHAFPDHHHFIASDFDSLNTHPIVMTEKDAVKCRALHLENAYYQPISLEFDDAFYSAFIVKLSTVIALRNSAPLDKLKNTVN